MQNSIRVTSFIYLQLSAEGQESVSRRSLSNSDEIETCIDLEERWHTVFPRQLRLTTGEELKYVCLTLHPIQVQKWQACRKQRLLQLLVSVSLVDGFYQIRLR